MQKLYVGILFSALFCSMNAMEVGLPALLASLDKSLNFEERLKEKKKAFEEAIEWSGDVQQAGEDILSHLHKWFDLVPCKKEMYNRDAVSTVDQDLLDAQERLGQNDYKKFRWWATNAENLIISLVRQQKREVRRQKEAREPERAPEMAPRERLYRTRRYDNLT
ncbi:hypothetical protein E3J61_03380 [Candidatus Dependentiae bacterium]|nr:MAG: hypothetical protein E3J61_03380 [Candidatus Dependentiae bacterium]